MVEEYNIKPEADTGFPERGGGGRELSRVWIFHALTFCSRIYMYHAMHGQTVGGLSPGGQNASQNCKGGQNAGHFMGQGGQNANLI